MDRRKPDPREVAACLRRCVRGVNPDACEVCVARNYGSDVACTEDLHTLAAEAIEELCRELRRHEGVARGKTCGTCRNFIRDPGRSTGRCRVRRYLRGPKHGREFVPTQSRTACKGDYEPMNQEDDKHEKET